MITAIVVGITVLAVACALVFYSACIINSQETRIEEEELKRRKQEQKGL